MLKNVSLGILICGIALTFTGFVFKFMHWPDVLKGTIAGPVMTAIGMVLLLIGVFRGD